MIFFPEFETLQYSLNLADDTFREPEDIKPNKDFAYYKERDEMTSRRIELNDKLKSIQLLEALELDDSHKRDILSKIDFRKAPRIVYEETKSAIRDIIGDEIVKERATKSVFMSKPWTRKSSRSNERGRRFSRDRRNNSYSRERSSNSSSTRKDECQCSSRSKSRERHESHSSRRNREASKERKSVNFSKSRRDSTPAAGIIAKKEVVMIFAYMMKHTMKLCLM